jgi:hypothetical protein
VCFRTAIQRRHCISPRLTLVNDTLLCILHCRVNSLESAVNLFGESLWIICD